MAPKASSVLDEIVAVYRLERDLLTIAARAIRKTAQPYLVGTGFVGRTVTDSQNDVERLRSRLDEMTVVALWIEFERFLVNHVLSQLHVLGTAPPPFDVQLGAHVEHQIEFSRFDDLLDLYKGWIDSNHIGNVKQIKDYRDWVSHRNPKRPTPAKVDPAQARAILGNVMDAIAPSSARS
ncbi:MAG: hypothetical protein JWM87_4395 [Candidatus Eremiobacteraeota bacterium]|nr:hypothetical protein [Candidatus Eremiobacteraeota bacterium]